MAAIILPQRWRTLPEGPYSIAAEFRNRVMFAWSAGMPRIAYSLGEWRLMANQAPAIVPGVKGRVTVGDGTNSLSASVSDLGTVDLSCIAVVRVNGDGDATPVISGELFGLYGSSNGALGISGVNYRNRIQAMWRYSGGIWTAGNDFDREFPAAGEYCVGCFHVGTVGGLFIQGTEFAYDPASTALTINGGTTFKINAASSSPLNYGGVQSVVYLRGPMSLAEYRAFVAAPYQFFAPLRRRLYFFGAAAATSYDQEGFRWRYDDGDEDGATFSAPQDEHSAASIGIKKRLRTIVNVTGTPSTEEFELQYRRVGSPSEGWRKVN